MKLNTINCILENGWAEDRQEAENLTKEQLKSLAEDLAHDVEVMGDDDFMQEHVEAYKEAIADMI